MEIAAEKGSHIIRNTDKLHGTESNRQRAQPPQTIKRINSVRLYEF